MKLGFDDIRNKFKDTKCSNDSCRYEGFVVGLSSSLKPDLKKLIELSDSDTYRFISCNEVDKIDGLRFDYWVLANTTFTIERQHERLNNGSAKIVYADSTDLTDRDLVDKLLFQDYLPYDQRHFSSKPCHDSTIPCCKHIIKGRLTIQEYLQKITGHHLHYSTGNTVALHMLAVAVILGLNPIYMIGVDLDYSMGYVDDTIPANADSFDPYYLNILHDFRIIRDSAKKIGIEIINLNKKAKYDIFKKGDISRLRY